MPTKATKGHTQARGHNKGKVKMFENIKAITANIRGINTCGKRQTLANKWEKECVDLALLTEVQKNTGGMEKEGNWGKFIVLYSMGIDPKKRKNKNKKGRIKRPR